MIRAIGESWLPCPGYEGRYAVSSWGHIRSLRKGGGVLSTPPNHDGYPHVCLRKDGKARVIQIHRLIALAFHGDKQNALHNEVAHLDSERGNPRADNLQWVSKVENRSHRKRHGTETCGERHGGTRLKEEQVHAIRADKRRCADIAAEYGISQYSVVDIKRRRRWIHLPERVSTIADLRVVRRQRVACWPWRLREPGEEHPIGAECVDCGIEIALPRNMAGREPVCLYCALDCGLIPAIEVEP